MPYGLYLSAEGANAQAKRLEILANNMANVDTVGFKRQLALVQARYAEAIEQGLLEPGTGAIEDQGGGVYVRQTQTDYSPGPLKHTQGRTDLAVEGDGFFVVAKGDESFLTRAGNFRFDADGRLVTQQGHAVLSDSGSPVAINPADPSWQWTTEGAIRQAGAVQNLAMVAPGSLGDLVPVGENLFRPLAEPEPLATDQRRVAVGYLEGSGVQPTVEMTQLIEASRAFEANVNMLKTQDEMLGGLVNRVLRPA